MVAIQLMFFAEKQNTIAGIRCKYTKTRRPVKVIHFEKFETRSEATKAEAAFKKLSRKNKDAYLIQREEESE